MDLDKAEVLSDYFASVFTSKWPDHAEQILEGRCMDLDNEDLRPTVGEDQVPDHLRILNAYRSVGPDEIQPWC